MDKYSCTIFFFQKFFSARTFIIRSRRTLSRSWKRHRRTSFLSNSPFIVVDGKRIRGFFSTPSILLSLHFPYNTRLPYVYIRVYIFRCSFQYHAAHAEELMPAAKRILPPALKLDYALLVARLTRLISRERRIAANIQKRQKRFPGNHCESVLSPPGLPMLLSDFASFITYSPMRFVIFRALAIMLSNDVISTVALKSIGAFFKAR